MKPYIAPLVAFMLLTSQVAQAADAPELPSDNRIRILTYSTADVYTVPTKYGYQTSIVFARNEEITTVSVGDRSMWQIIPSGNRIFIRPMDDNLTTNMTVITNMREYTFDIKSVGPEQTNNLYVVQFRYPGGSKDTTYETMYEPPPARPAAPVAEPVALTPAPQPQQRVADEPLPLAPVLASDVAIPPLDTQRTQSFNYDYSYTGPDAIAPAQVFDDGKKTYVVYNSLPYPVPAPFVYGTDGRPSEARHSVEGNKLVIQVVTPGFVLKSSSGEVKVYNEMFKS